MCFRTVIIIAAVLANFRAQSNFDDFFRADKISRVTKQGIRINSFLHGNADQVLFEKSAEDVDPAKAHLMWSVAKSVLNLMVGVSVDQGLIKLDQSLCKYLIEAPKWICAVKIRNLLEMNSGIAWVESYESKKISDLENSFVLQMLYGSGTKGVERFIYDSVSKLVTKPGAVWRYSSGDSYLLSAVLKRALGSKYEDILYKEIFDKLNMKNSYIEKDSQGVFVGSSYFWSTPHDMYNLGLMVLNEGVFNGKRIVSKGWLDYSFTVNTAVDFRNLDTYAVPGAHWWINSTETKKGMNFSSAISKNSKFAMGHWGQRLLVDPERSEIFVVLSDTRDNSFELDRIIAEYRSEKFVSPKKAKPVIKNTDTLLLKENVFRMFKNFSAKMMCSCLFLAKKSFSECQNFVRIDPHVYTFKIDYKLKNVKSKMLWQSDELSSKASFKNIKSGCHLYDAK